MEKRFVEPPGISIEDEKCTRCGLCVRICPTRIFDSSEGGLPVARHAEECVLCGQCLCACPADAILNSGFLMSNFKRIRDKNPVTSESAFELLSQRRSVRNYRKEPPSEELLEKIIRIAGYAPGSPHHRVGWVRQFAVVQGTQAMKDVLEMTAEYLQRTHALLTGWMIRAASKFSGAAKAGLAVVPDLEMRLSEYRMGRDAMTYGAPAAIFAHAPVASSTPQTDCDTALLMIQLYAEAHGLGTCWNGLIQMAAAGDHVRGFTKLAEFLKIPKGHKCYAAMTIGTPAIALHSIPERRVEIAWVKDPASTSTIRRMI